MSSKSFLKSITCIIKFNFLHFPKNLKCHLKIQIDHFYHIKIDVANEYYVNKIRAIAHNEEIIRTSLIHRPKASMKWRKTLKSVKVFVMQIDLSCREQTLVTTLKFQVPF